MQLNSVFQDWLTVNKISVDVQKDFDISFNNNAIVIPVHDENGFFIFNKYRRSPLINTGVKYWYDKGGKVTLYGWFKAKNHNKILIVEGEKDCLVSWSHNIPCVTSTGGAQSFQKDWGTLFKDKEVILCFDNDEAGGMGMAKALDIIPHAKIVLLPKDANIKDISDYVLANGDLESILRTAKSFSSIADVEAHKTERLAQFQSVFFHDAYIKIHKKYVITPNQKRVYSSDDVANARQYPIDQLLDFAANKTICPFHAEKTPSFVLYPKDNHCYCFGGCGKAYDAISIYQKLNNCTFREAVDALNKKV
jgi:DNA primase